MELKDINSYQQKLSLDIKLSHKATRKQRRSYNCGPCKKQKIKCDMLIPCGACTRYKRHDKCLAEPPNPPSPSEMAKKMKKKSKRIPSISLSDGTSTAMGSHPNDHSSIPSASNFTTPYQTVDYDSGNLYTLLNTSPNRMVEGNKNESPSFSMTDTRQPSNLFVLPLPTKNMSKFPTFQEQVHSGTAKYRSQYDNSPPSKLQFLSPFQQPNPPNIPFNSNSLFTSLHSPEDSIAKKSIDQTSSRNKSIYKFSLPPTSTSLTSASHYGNHTLYKLNTNDYSGRSHHHKSESDSDSNASPLDESKKSKGSSNDRNHTHESVNTVSELKSSLMMLQRKIDDIEKSAKQTTISNTSTQMKTVLSDGFLELLNKFPKHVSNSFSESSSSGIISVQFKVFNEESSSLRCDSDEQEKQLFSKMAMTYMPASFDLIRKFSEFEQSIRSISYFFHNIKDDMTEFENYCSSRNPAAVIDFAVMSRLFFQLSQGILLLSDNELSGDNCKNSLQSFSSFESTNSISKISSMWFDLSLNSLNYIKSDECFYKYREIGKFIMEDTHYRMKGQFHQIYSKLSKIVGVSYILGLHHGKDDSLTDFENDLREKLWVQLILIDFDLSSKLGEPRLFNLAYFPTLKMNYKMNYFWKDESIEIKIMNAVSCVSDVVYSNDDAHLDKINKILNLDKRLNEILTKDIKIYEKCLRPKNLISKFLQNLKILLHKIKINSFEISNSSLVMTIYTTSILNSLNYYKFLRLEIGELLLFENYLLFLEPILQILVHILVYLTFASPNHHDSKTVEFNLATNKDLAISDLINLSKNNPSISLLQNGLRLIMNLNDIFNHFNSKTNAKKTLDNVLDSIKTLTSSQYKLMISIIGGERYFQQYLTSLWSSFQTNSRNNSLDSVSNTSNEIFTSTNSTHSTFTGYVPADEVISLHLSHLSETKQFKSSFLPSSSTSSSTASSIFSARSASMSHTPNKAFFSTTTEQDWNHAHTNQIGHLRKISDHLLPPINSELKANLSNIKSNVSGAGGIAAVNGRSSDSSCYISSTTTAPTSGMNLSGGGFNYRY